MQQDNFEEKMEKNFKGRIADIPDSHLEVREYRPIKVWSNYLNDNVLGYRLEYLKKM
jgi:hypothetical protein